MRHGHRHEDLVAALDAERAAGKDSKIMLHNWPPGSCWCGEKHTPGQVLDLNVLKRQDLPPDTGPGMPPSVRGADARLRRRRTVSRRPDGADDRLDAAVREHGGWDAVTDEQLNRLIADQREKDAEDNPE